MTTDAPLLTIVQEILQSQSLVFRNSPDLATHRGGAALDIILSTPTLPGLVTVHSDHMLCSCHLDILQASLSSNSAHPPSLPRVRARLLPSQSLCLAPVRLGARLWPTP